jgi:hypothetical protein
MLTVDIDQSACQVGEGVDCGKSPPDKDPVAACARDHPLHQEISFALYTSLSEHCQDIRSAGEIEECFYDCLILSGTDQIDGGAATKNQIHGVNDDRLTRTGLSGKDIQALPEFHVQVVDYGKIFNK